MKTIPRSTFSLLITFCFFSCATEFNEVEGKVYIAEVKIYVQVHETTVEDFKGFIETNEYKTTADSLGWSGVFNRSQNRWEVVNGANWRSPDGLSTDALMSTPVTQVSYADACAYCDWVGGRLPTAQEWDIIAGDDIIKGNVWEGPFPFHDEGSDGYKKRVAPVGQFQPNDKGIHDLFGNVWEWTSTTKNDSLIVIKGGSFLCDVSFCSGYIPARFQSTPKNSGLNHLGFRCVFDEAPKR